MDKKQWVYDTLHNKETGKIPVGFWHHFMEYKDMTSGMTDPAVFRKCKNGYMLYKQQYKPDFVKMMVDGFFFLPYDYASFKTAEDFKNLPVIDEKNPFIAKNVELVKYVRDLYGDDIMIFFNVFSPFAQIRDAVRFAQGIPMTEDKMIDYLAQDKEIMKKAMMTFAQSAEVLMKQVIGEGLADGLYFCVSDPSGEIPYDLYEECMRPSEEYILAAARKLTDSTILHMCCPFGEDTGKFLNLYSSYDVCCVNWPTKLTGVSLAAGRKIFEGKCLLGGFDNNAGSLLLDGSKEEIQEETRRLVEEAGRKGLIIGADCTIPETVNPKHIAWVKEALAEI